MNNPESSASSDIECRARKREDPLLLQEYPSTAVAWTVMLSCLISVFLVSLDRTILATAIPTITDYFDSMDDISWYASAYLLANCSLQLLYGKLYQLYSAKKVFLTSILLFEIGSAVCGAAPSSAALIIGRAIAGAGSSGVMSGTMQIMVSLVPLHKRPLYTGLFSTVFGISSVVGPILGGALTQRLSWRWCFYINLPFAAVSIGGVSLLMKARGSTKPHPSARELFRKLDLLGLVLFIPSISCLIIAVQWGGLVYPWNSGRITSLFITSGVAFMAWVTDQAWASDNATVPPRVIFQRTIASGFSYSFMFTSSMLILIYYIPLWLQVVKGDTPVTSGLHFLPFIMALSASSILFGALTQKIGYYNPAIITSSIVASIGGGLITTLTPAAGSPHWIGYEFICGFGSGMALQQSSLAAQAVLPTGDVPIGIALMLFAQQLGGAVFLSVGQNIFAKELVTRLGNIAGLDARTILKTGATELRAIIPESKLGQFLAAYNGALVHTWYIAVALSSAAVIPALCMEWTCIRKEKNSCT